jgi:hypothetical protein
MKNFLKLLSCVVAMCLTISLPALAQMTSGAVSGTVKDTSDAVVASAKVTVTDEATNISTSSTTNGKGEFLILNLLPGLYDLKTEGTGFQDNVVKGIDVELSQTSTVDVKLTVGSASATIEVAAGSATTLDTTTVNLSSTLSTTEVQVLPAATVGLGVLNTSLLVPGVASAGGIGIGTGPSVGGQRPRDNNFTVEGIDNNNKSVTGPLVFVPNEAVADFTLITTQFSPEFGHSNGGQFNTNVLSGTNSVHGALYEYFQNRNLNAELGTQGGKPPIDPRFDFNRYGGQAGAPIIHNKLFAFGNFERQTTGQSLSYYLCTPTAAGLTTLNTLPTYGFNATNLAQYLKYTPAANAYGGAQVTAAQDLACGESATLSQAMNVYPGTTLTAGEYASGTPTSIPLGNYLVSAPVFTNFDALTTSGDYTISSKDSLRLRYLYNTQGSQDTAANFPEFYQSLPYKYHLIAISEFHSFTSNLSNEFRLGFNRYANTTPAGNFSYPGLDMFPNLVFDELDLINYGPDSNAPQSTVQNLYQITNVVSWTKSTHTFTIGFDGRKFIAPETFTQRVRGDYEWDYLTEFLHDLAPTSFAQRSTGNFIYYGDQTAFYGFGNDTWRISPTLTVNYGLRYEFTSVPTGERAQKLNAAASVPGVLTFGQPTPQYKNFAPRAGINWSPDAKTSIRAGFGLGYDVIFDNIGLLSFPPQYSSTNSVGDGNINYTGNMNPTYGAPGFLGGYSNEPGAPTIHGLPPGNGGLATFTSLASQRSATSAYVANQSVPYAESWNLQLQRSFGNNYVATLGYVGTRGIHLLTQDQLNKQPKVTTANQLPTYFGAAAANIPTSGPSAFTISTSSTVNTLGAAATSTSPANGIVGLNSAVIPAYSSAGFTGTITAYEPYSQSDYNGLTANLTRRMQNGLQMNLSYTYSKTMDDATAEVNSTGLTPRRQQNSQCISCDYSRSALDRTHRITLEAIYDVPFFKNSGFLMHNLAGNWEIVPVYTYQSPEYTTVLSGVNSNLNGDTGSAIDRTIINPSGSTSVGSNGSAVAAVYSNNPTLYGLCPATASKSTFTGLPICGADTVGYVATSPNAYYIEAGTGTLPNASRNTLPLPPSNNLDLTALKRISFKERYSFEIDANALNVLNHAQYTAGKVSTANQTSTAGVVAFNTATSGFFDQAGKVFTNNPRVLQLSAKLRF